MTGETLKQGQRKQTNSRSQVCRSWCCDIFAAISCWWNRRSQAAKWSPNFLVRCDGYRHWFGNGTFHGAWSV